MFPPNLQKNIRELDRQISLLETECENIDSEKKDSGFARCPSSVRVLPGKAFVTGPRASVGPYISARFNPAVANGLKNMLSNQEVLGPRGKQDEFKQVPDGNGPSSGLSASDPLHRKIPKQVVHKEVLVASPGETIEVTVMQKSSCSNADTKKAALKRSMGSIREVSESSDENVQTATELCTTTHNGSLSAKTKDQNLPEKCLQQFYGKDVVFDGSRRYDATTEIALVQENQSKENFSDAEGSKEADEGLDKWPKTLNCDQLLSEKQLSTKRNRFRSVRTKKKCENEIPIDLAISKGLQEKEIQCMILREEKEKEEFLLNLNDSIKNLHFLIGELKSKSCEEKRDNVLHDMQNTLTKLSQDKSSNVLNSSLNLLASLQSGNGRLAAREENAVDLRKTFLCFKQLSEQLSEEKSRLSDELDSKNDTITKMRNKEREYLTVISHLKCDLDRVRDQTSDYERVKKDLSAATTKLDEETKVIEALKKSHAKMQDLVESYVLENDKLRTQLRLTKLETHKFNIILAGKEEEIRRYKTEMGSFQRQICNQLNLLRSKASDNQVETTLKTIANHTSILSPAENESETVDYSERLSVSTSKISVDSTWSRMLSNQNRIEDVSSSTIHGVQGKQATPSGGQQDRPEPCSLLPEEDGNDGCYTSCRSDESEAKVDNESGKFENSFQGAINSKRLRSNIDDILQDIRMKPSDRIWTSIAKSCWTSLPSTSTDLPSELESKP